MKIAIVLFLSLISSYSFADCTVSARMDNIYKVECTNYLGQSTLYDEVSKEYIVLKSNNQILTVDGGEASFDIGSTLYLNPQVRNDARPIAIEVDMNEPKPIFDPLKANNYRLFAKGLSYEHESVSADFGFSGTSIETSNNEFKTLPLAFQLEMIFDSYGIILGPDFESEAGEVIFYKNFSGFTLGFHAKLSIENKNTEVTSGNTRLQDDEETSTTIQTGVYARLEREMGEKWFFYGESRIGYYRDVSKAYNNLKNTYQENIIDAAFVQIEPSMYYQISENFKFGFGASLLLGVGLIQVKDQTGVISDGVTLSTFGLYPVKLQMAF